MSDNLNLLFVYFDWGAAERLKKGKAGEAINAVVAMQAARRAGRLFPGAGS